MACFLLAYDDQALAFVQGEMIAVERKEDSGTWYGRVGDRVGFFPCRYVEEIESTQPSQPVEWDVRLCFRCTVLFNFCLLLIRIGWMTRHSRSLRCTTAIRMAS